MCSRLWDFVLQSFDSAHFNSIHFTKKEEKFYEIELQSEVDSRLVPKVLW